MGKRCSDFARRAVDAYPTPYAAVIPLLPHLGGICHFAEPCCGDGDLVRHLESLGLCCAYADDLATGQDALARRYYGVVGEVAWRPSSHASRNRESKMIESSRTEAEFRFRSG